MSTPDRGAFVFVEQIMTEDPLQVEQGTSLAEAIRIMKNHRIGSVVVVEKNRPAYRGILTETMIISAFEIEGRENMQNMQVDDYMMEFAATVSRKHSIRDVLHIMRKTSIDHVTILDGVFPVGIVSHKDIIKFLGDQLDSNPTWIAQNRFNDCKVIIYKLDASGSPLFLLFKSDEKNSYHLHGLDVRGEQTTKDIIERMIFNDLSVKTMHIHEFDAGTPSKTLYCLSRLISKAEPKISYQFAWFSFVDARNELSASHEDNIIAEAMIYLS